MPQINVELVKYDTEKTQKRKRANLLVDSKSEDAVIAKLERIHKGDKVKTIHEIIWGEVKKSKKKEVILFTGTVKFFDQEKGFGFIRPHEDMDDLFFHASALGGISVHDQDLVEFEVREGPKGPVAIHISLVEE
jgi:CspA family cold shock protein